MDYGLILHIWFSFVGPNILLRIFLSKTNSFWIVVSFNTHVSEAHVTIGLITFLYNFNFEYLVTNLLLKNFWFAETDISYLVKCSDKTNYIYREWAGSNIFHCWFVGQHHQNKRHWMFILVMLTKQIAHINFRYSGIFFLPFLRVCVCFRFHLTLTFNFYICVQRFKHRCFLRPYLFEVPPLNTSAPDSSTCNYTYFIFNKYFLELTTTTKDSERQP